MQIICVDDEELILAHTAKLCRELPLHPHVESFSNVEKALDWITQHVVDIAILDINMPDMSGLALAAKIKKESPHTAILFLTGYPEYAVEAWDLHASGYLLKPVGKERLKEEILYVMQGKGNRLMPHIFAQTFGEFDLFVDGNPVSFARSKSKELLAYLIDRQGGCISRANAFSILWEEGVYDRSMQKQLDVAIRSLRDTLKEYDVEQIFELQKGMLRVVPETFACDAYDFCAGKLDAINAFQGEYMNAYSWANAKEAFFDRSNEQSE